MNLERVRAIKPAVRETLDEAEQGPWIVRGSRRIIVPSPGPGDFDPYAPIAESWIKTLEAKVVVALGVRFDAVARALLAGVRAVDGHVWGVDPLERHDVRDERFTFLPLDPMEAVERWQRIDVLHIDAECQAT